MLIQIGDKIVTDELFTRKFMCDLNKCKGACCVEGEDGAPVTTDEIKIIEELLPKIKPYMITEGIEKVEKDGVAHADKDGDMVTNLVSNGACAFVFYDERGIAKCAIEKAYRNGDINWKKPISCELFPIRAKKFPEFTALNYEEIDICKPGCVLGEKMNIPLYQFLKNAIIRAYGEEFYQELDKVFLEIQKEENE
ncbi:MAG: DUF3109 family protein [Brumimicrobium sp.]|nr:DUF3109 family protein [Brumimicrobium sp.]